MFHAVSGFLALYVFWRLVFPLPVSRAARGGLSIALLLGAGHQLVTRNFFGTMASPEIPFELLIVLGWLHGAVCFTGLLLIFKDLLGLLSRLPFGRLSRFLLGSRALPRFLACTAMLLSAIAVWQAIRVPDVRRIDIVLPDLPPQLDGYRLVHLTDLHASRLLQAPWIAAVVDKANALSPDLMVVTGDLVDGTPQARREDVAPMARLAARQGVYAIPGNHEYYADYAGWLEAFRFLNIPMLLNSHVTISHNGGAFVLAGVTDNIAPRFGQRSPDLATALAGAPAGYPVILLAHRPVDARENAAAGVSLQLSGHTHGGQILGFHKLVQQANAGFVSGLYEIGAMRLYVSNGTGLWPGLPLRLGKNSEITEITLRSARR